MGESVKQKGTVQNKKKNVSVTAPNMTLYEKDYIMSNLLNILFEQVKLQQEVRDRWFGHYLTIIGALTALATLCLKIFENMVHIEMLYLFLGLLFIFAFCLGNLFYILYIHQRRNYKQLYNFLSTVQKEIFKSIPSIPSKLYEKDSFAAKRHGADFYTLLIQSLIDAAMLAIGIVFLAISQKATLHKAFVIASTGAVAILIVLQLIRYFFKE